MNQHRFHTLLLLLFGILPSVQSDVAEPLPPVSDAEGEPCEYAEGTRYSLLVMRSRLNDFYANNTHMGFGTFDSEGRMIDGEAGTKGNLDYVPGLVGKAVLEAVDYYKGDPSVDVRPYFYAVQHYADKYDVSWAGQQGMSFDDLNAVKMYSVLQALSKSGTFPDGKAYTNAQNLQTAGKRFSAALNGIRTANSQYVIKSSTLAGAAGGWWHKSSYQNQMWCDGQYMGPALLAQIINDYSGYKGITSDDWALITKQFSIAWKYLWNEDERLLYHAFTATPAKTTSWAGVSAQKGHEVYHSAEFWGRAEGWYMLALVDVLEQMTKAGQEHTADYAILHGYLAKLAEGVAARQDAESGCWYQLLAHDGDFSVKASDGKKYNYLESSCSAIFTAAFLKGMRLGLLDDKYVAMARKAYRGLVEQFMNSDGKGGVHLVGSCRSAGLGNGRDGSAAYYLTGTDVTVTENVTEGKVLGAFILAAVEYERRFLDTPSAIQGVAEITPSQPPHKIVIGHLNGKEIVKLR